MTCWPGDRLWLSASPLRRSRTASRNARTTPSSTSASNSAARTSPKASSTSASLRRPRERRDVPSRSKRSLRASNMWLNLPSGVEERIDEGLRFEGDQVVDAFADAHELDGNPQVALDGDDDPAARRPVEFGEHDAGHVGRGEELTCLAQRVLSGRGV